MRLRDLRCSGRTWWEDLRWLPGQRTPAHFFNTAAFATAPQFTYRQCSRNPVRGPAYRDLDLALVKHTRCCERPDLEFRAELFDVTNTPAFCAAEWELRGGGVWEHYEYDDGPEGGAVRDSI